MGSRASRAGTGRPFGAHIFSVAQHTLLVDAIARRRNALDRRARLAILLHDAPEYVIGDMITPFKAVIGDAYKAVESRLLAAIHLRFGLPPALPAELTRLIKSADRAAAYLEATRLAGFGESEAKRFFGTPPDVPAALRAGLSGALGREGRAGAVPEAICRAGGGLSRSPYQCRSGATASRNDTERPE